MGSENFLKVNKRGGSIKNKSPYLLKIRETNKNIVFLRNKIQRENHKKEIQLSEKKKKRSKMSPIY